MRLPKRLRYAWYAVRYSSHGESLFEWRYGWRWRYALDKFHERRFGTETMHDVSLDSLGVAAPGRVWYVPSEWTGLRRAIQALRVGRNDVFVDFGSGKGRAVLVAAQFPFKRVLGIEISETLTQLARRNLERRQRRLRCRDVELVTADVLGFDIPADITVAYFFCPFTGELFHNVIQRLIASFDRAPRPIRVVYNYPYEHNYLLTTGRVHVVDVRPNRWPPRSLTGQDVIVTYLIVPPNTPQSRQAALASSRGLRRAPVWLGPHAPGFRLGGREAPQSGGQGGS